MIRPPHRRRCSDVLFWLCVLLFATLSFAVIMSQDEPTSTSYERPPESYPAETVAFPGGRLQTPAGALPLFSLDEDQ